MAEQPKLVVGQKLWYVPNRARECPLEVTVEAVGRKWATIDRRNRISVETLEADGAGYSSPGRCYLTRREWEDEQERLAAIRAFRSRVGEWSWGKGITTDAIRQAAALLGIELPAARTDTKETT